MLNAELVGQVIQKKREQKKLSQEWNVTEKYIQILNKRLIVWLEQAITQEQKQ